jgi:hypothetical protein
MYTVFRKRPGSLWLPGGLMHGGAAKLLAQLDARSDALNGLVPGITGMVQPFADTVDGYYAQCGSPPAFSTADCQAGFMLHNAHDQFDSFVLVSKLVAAGGPLGLREAVGFVNPAVFDKACVEKFGGADRYISFLNDVGDYPVTVVHGVFRTTPNAAAAPRWLFTKSTGVIGWGLECGPGFLQAGAFAVSAVAATIAIDPRDSAWHWFVVILDDVAQTITLRSDLGSVTSPAYAGSARNASPFTLGYAAVSFSGQLACCYVLNADWGAGADAAFWHHALAAGLGGVANTHTRAGTLRAPILARDAGGIQVHRTAGYGANQPGWGLNVNLDSTGADGNPDHTGLIFEDPITFEYVGSNDLFTNGIALNATSALADGSSGMRDGVRVTQVSDFGLGGGYAYLYGGGIPLVGASNVPWRVDADYRQATFGTTARMAMYFDGDPGGFEYILALADNAVPADWTRGGGSVLPTRPAHILYYVLFGAALGPTGGDPGQDCDFSEMAVVKNRTTAPLAHCLATRTAWVTSAAPVESIANVGNANYHPAKGHAEVTLAGFSGAVPPNYVGSYALGGSGYDVGIDKLGRPWVLSYGGNQIHVYDPATMVDVPGSPFATGAGPTNVSFDALGRAWVACYGANQIRVYDPITLAQVLGSPIATAAGPEGVAIDAAGKAWVIDYTATEIQVFDGATLLEVAGSPIALGGNGYGVAIDGNNQAWVTVVSTGNVRVYNCTTLAEVAGSPIAVGGLPRIPSVDALGRVWVCTQGSIRVFNPATLAEVAGSPIAGVTGSYQAAMDAFGRAWVTSITTNYLRLYDTTTFAKVAQYDIGSDAYGLAYDDIGQMMIATWTTGQARVYRVDPTFLSCGAAGARGALVLDYAGHHSVAPLAIPAAQLRLRIWDNAAALVAEVPCGTLNNVQHKLSTYWSAVGGTMSVRDAACRRDYTVNHHPTGVIAANGHIWVICTGTNNVMKFDGATGELIGTYATGAGPAEGCYDGTNIWIANTGAGTVTKLTEATGALVGAYATGAGPSYVAYDAGTASIWVTDSGAGTVTKLDAATGAWIGTYAVGLNPAGIISDGTNLWICNYLSSTITLLAAATGAPVATLACPNPYGCTFDGVNVWVVMRLADSVRKYVAATQAVVGTYAVGAGPVNAAYDGTYLWVTNFTGDSVSQLDAATGAAVGTHAVGTGPIGIAYLATYVWTANYLADTATEFRPARLLGAAAPGAWVPSAVDVTPLYLGTDAAGANAARALISRLRIFDA